MALTRTMLASDDNLASVHGVTGRGMLPARPHPVEVLRLVQTVAPWLFVAAALFCALGLAMAFGIAPSEFGRGELFRIAYVHVPATWVALLLYVAIVGCAGLQLLSSARLASMVLEAIAPTAAMFALLALWTGSIWSKAATDIWWNWDARRLSDLTLLAFTVGCVLLREALAEGRSVDVAVAVFALLGGMVLVVVLREVAFVPQAGAHPSTDTPAAGAGMIAALASMAAGFLAYAAAVALMRLRCVILERNRGCDWAQHWSER